MCGQEGAYFSPVGDIQRSIRLAVHIIVQDEGGLLDVWNQVSNPVIAVLDGEKMGSVSFGTELLLTECLA